MNALALSIIRAICFAFIPPCVFFASQGVKISYELPEYDWDVGMTALAIGAMISAIYFDGFRHRLKELGRNLFLFLVAGVTAYFIYFAILIFSGFAFHLVSTIYGGRNILAFLLFFLAGTGIFISFRYTQSSRTTTSFVLKRALIAPCLVFVSLCMLGLFLNAGFLLFMGLVAIGCFSHLVIQYYLNPRANQ
jgi:hypothetical protein